MIFDLLENRLTNLLETSFAVSDAWVLQNLKVSLWSVRLDFEKNDIV